MAPIVLLLLATFVTLANTGTYGASSYSNQFYGPGASFPQYTNEHKQPYRADIKRKANTPSSYYKPNLSKSHHLRKSNDNARASSYVNNDFFFPNDVNSQETSEKIFTYDDRDEYGPSNWYKISAQCKGNFQSPIAIDIQNTSAIKFSPGLAFEGIDVKPTSLNVENNGHSMKIQFPLPNNGQIKVSGGPLSSPYILDNAHWHWGRTDENGSEHIVKGRRYSAELHLVFYNSQYESFEAAASEPKGLAVLGIVYYVDDRHNGYINPWAVLIHRVLNAKSSHVEYQKTFTIRELIRTENFKYFSYKGSLTTPNCTENVTWMISSKPIPIASSELKELRKLRNEKGEQMFSNYRPLQHSASIRKITIHAH